MQIFSLIDRITPAYAGRILNSFSVCCGGWDHPRIRGKNISIACRLNATPGSPPHTREECRRNPVNAAKAGITPAYAGRIQIIKKVLGIERDHPRIRGKNNNRMTKNKVKRGSPPHTREEFKYVFPCTFSLRITPAYAGRMLLGYTFLSLVEDHPRIRGKNIIQGCLDTSTLGSPPHTREEYLKIPSVYTLSIQ